MIWLHDDGRLIRSVRIALGMNPAEFASLLAGRLGWEVPVGVLLGWESQAGKPPASVMALVRELARDCRSSRPMDGDSREDVREAT